MNDQQIEDLILDVIKRREITWLDMVSGRCISYEADHKRIFRNNRFITESWSDRIIEVLCDEDYDPLSECHIIRIPFCDLFQFWWNQCICQEDMMDEILEDIYIYFKDRLQPIKEETAAPDNEIDFSKLSISHNKAARLSRKGGGDDCRI